MGNLVPGIMSPKLEMFVHPNPKQKYENLV